MGNNIIFKRRIYVEVEQEKRKTFYRQQLFDKMSTEWPLRLVSYHTYITIGE